MNKYIQAGWDAYCEQHNVDKDDAESMGLFVAGWTAGIAKFADQACADIDRRAAKRAKRSRSKYNPNDPNDPNYVHPILAEALRKKRAGLPWP